VKGKKESGKKKGGGERRHFKPPKGQGYLAQNSVLQTYQPFQSLLVLWGKKT